MKRIIICAFIVVLLTILGIASYLYTQDAMEKTEAAIDSVSASFSENSELTGSLAKKLTAQWRENCGSYIFIFDRDHIMELTAVIARIEAYAEENDPEILVECRQAKELIRLYHIKEDFYLPNIF